VHQQRAKSRAEGLAHLKALLQLDRFAAIRHQVCSFCVPSYFTYAFVLTSEQILGCLASLFRGGHYLDHISAAGVELTQRVSAAFQSVLEQLTPHISSPSVDASSRLLALGAYALRYQDADAELLSRFGILRLLHHVSHETAAAAPSAMEIEGQDKEAQRKRKEEIDRETTLQAQVRVGAWTAFRLLSVLCVSWERDPHRPEILLSLQQQVNIFAICHSFHF
jgi:hypothetical protein